MSNHHLQSTNSPLQTPVLLLTFKRLDTTKQVLEAIRKAKPKYLYISSDGPRFNYPGEAKKVQAVREYVINNIDWECEVETLFREQNLGGPVAVTQSLNWFFARVKEGIILEDDCLPTPSFFRFCETMLERYKNDERIVMISGRNPCPEFTPDSAKNYFLANIGKTWGWATWRRAFQGFTLDYPSLENTSFMSQLWQASGSTAEFEKAKRNLLQMNSQNYPNWDYLWNIRQILKRKYAIFPCQNMIKNIGFGPEATHTKEGEDSIPIVNVQSDFPTEEIYDPNFSRLMIEKKHKSKVRFLFNLFCRKTRLFFKHY